MIRCLTVGLLDTNCYVFSPSPAGSGVVIIDPGDEGGRIAEAVFSLGIEPAYVALTHGHFDHVRGLNSLLAVLAERGFRPKIAVHTLDAAYLGAEGFKAHGKDFAAFGPLSTLLSGFFRDALPEADLLLEEGDELAETGLRILHTPGHTPGSICLYDAAGGNLFSGDTLFAGGFGRTDLAGGDYGKLVSSLRRLSDLPPETSVYPGHGERTTVGAEPPASE
jgi:hydroxyacylglutathione hydrolase